jgi:ATP-dependent DNA helicase RecQ
MAQPLAFIDLEIGKNGQIIDIGCLKADGQQYHGRSVQDLYKFLQGTEFLCGHNIIYHDLKYLRIDSSVQLIDTLFFSPLLFPAKPYHRLVKDYKLDPENSNNPLTDSIKAKELFEDEMSKFDQLDRELQDIFFHLLHDKPGFSGFFSYRRHKPKSSNLKEAIAQAYSGTICSNAKLDHLIFDFPIELAYALALIRVNDVSSILPPWVMKSYPNVQKCFRVLRSTPCLMGCDWCQSKLEPVAALKRWFGYPGFRSFDGEPLQEKAVRAAINNESLLAVFPTGGGKSITFQLPALIAGENERGLTVVISPLQSLMKDQVDNLEKKGITEAVTINGLLDPIERARSIERVYEGGANILYISPESLRNNTIQRLLEGRHIARFVIDEAHCFSAWGQDFRTDYLYIGDFIKKLQETKNLDYSIPVSCFTATAKQRVIDDIRKYFKEKLNLTLALFTSKARRTNLRYKVLACEKSEKYQALRTLLEAEKCPTIIYVSRTRTAEYLAETLCEDGFNAEYYHGKMDSRDRIAHQESFMDGTTDIIVATSAFGMGVDKSDVGLVIHYEISDSLENYIQEAGRAGRDERIVANCYILFDEEDLNKHFVLLNQTKLTKAEINQVWKAIKNLTKKRTTVSNSALEIARKAGWDDEVADIESRIITAIAALEQSGYLLRGNNSPRVFATGILAPNAQDAIEQISASEKFTNEEKEIAGRIIKRLFSAKRISESMGEGGETRVDYLADILGLHRETVIHIINLLREEKILADSKDLNAFIKRSTREEGNIKNIAARFLRLEEFLLKEIQNGATTVHLKELNQKAAAALGEDVNPRHFKTIFNIWAIQGWLEKKRDGNDNNYYSLKLKFEIENIAEKIERRKIIAATIVQFLFEKAQLSTGNNSDEVPVEFSVLEAKEYFKKSNQIFQKEVKAKDIEDTLFYLAKIEAISIEGGFLVLYNRLSIERKELNPHVMYKNEDYVKLEEHYQSKIQQIHIVGEYAQRMINNYNDALQFADDYFQVNYSSFLHKYFPKRANDLNLKITKRKFEQLFGGLSLEQSQVMQDNSSQYIVVAAGPGSGKTRVLVHKLASLLQLEDVKHEQLLMLTFSRAAASEFKSKLYNLIGNAAYYVEIKTFHSYCFDLLGKLGDLEHAESIIETAISKIRSGEISLNRITKSVLVIDEAQDISSREFELIKLLVEMNEEMRVVLVGDDDQNIFEWRGASADCLKWFLKEKKATAYKLLDNYRSKAEIIELANKFVTTIQNRLKGEPIVSKQGPGAIVKITQYHSPELLLPTVNAVIKTQLSGSVAVLTTTNEEASMVASLLQDRGFKSKLIQSNDNFRLQNLLELRFFSDNILASPASTHTIDPDLFEQSVLKLKSTFAGSPNLELVIRIITLFRQEYAKKMYKSDWQSYLVESRLENFYAEESEVIQVATIHKAKGREFDNVFILLNNFQFSNDEKRRLLYVAMTRARNHLQVHYKGDYLQPFVTPEISYSVDQNVYSEPGTLSLILDLKQVWLSFGESSYRQYLIENLRPGQQLQISEDGSGCDVGKDCVVKFAKAFQEKLKKYLDKGYKPSHAFIRYIVYWINESNKEIRVILPEIKLQKT